MNVAYLKVMHGLCFHPIYFFFFLGAGLQMSFHRHSCPSIVIICIQPQTWGASGRARWCGCGNGASRFLFVFFEQLGWCPPRSWCPTQTEYSAYSAYREQQYCPEETNQPHLHLEWLSMSTFSVNFHFWMNYSFNTITILVLKKLM